MKQISLLALVMLHQQSLATEYSGTLEGQSIQLPSDVTPFVEPSMTPVALEEGDLAGNGRRSYLLVLQNENSDRVLLILDRQDNGSLKLRGKNARALVCGNCTGMGGGFGMAVFKGGFFVDDSFGSGLLNRRLRFEFRYLSKTRAWTLMETQDEVNDGYSIPELHTTNVLRVYPKESITFSAFNGEKFGVQCAF